MAENSAAVTTVVNRLRLVSSPKRSTSVHKKVFKYVRQEKQDSASDVHYVMSQQSALQWYRVKQPGCAHGKSGCT